MSKKIAPQQNESSWEVGNTSLDLSPEAFARFASFITAELGMKMPESKLALVQSRLVRRIRDLRMKSADEYADYFFASSHAGEREHFINAITTNKTDFFREPDHFNFLCDVILPDLGSAAARRGERFKVWSAGCSSGEEAYTTGMLLADYAIRQPGFDFAILGTDISTKVLASARSAIYHEAQLVDVPPEFRRKYLLRSRNKADHVSRIIPELRRKISFHQLNFMDDDYLIKDIFDVVFFRNVMIYFDRPIQEAVINKICRNLAPGGYLFSSHSESVAGLDIPVKSIKAAVYRKVA
jgi:chemotaxis protein methyltransferase CheR